MVAESSLQPVQKMERLQVLDVLRGFALLGIILINVEVFAGHFALAPGQAESFLLGQADATTSFLLTAVIQGKFYSLFSLLFGIGFAIILQRTEQRGQDFAPFFRRRLWGLMLIGAIHAFLIWAGDILFLYALLGFFLLWFRHKSDQALLRWGAGLLLSPIAVYALMLAFQAPDPFAALTSAEPQPSSDDVNLAAQVFAGFAEGNYFQMVWSNFFMLAIRWVNLFLTVRFPKVLGMFVLGFYAGRAGLFGRLEENTPLLKRLLWLGIGVGIPANLLLAYLTKLGVYLPASPLGLLETVAYAVGVPTLCLGYVSLLTLLFQRPGMCRYLLALFAPAGRMALTNYLLQSVLLVLVFYGVGLGFFGQVSLTLSVLIAAVVFAVQIPFSHWWQSQFLYGPAEWGWRQLTYGKRLPFKRSGDEAS